MAESRSKYILRSLVPVLAAVAAAPAWGFIAWRLSLLLAGLVPLVGKLLAWLAATWPGSPKSALLAFFAAHFLITLPLRLTSARVDRATGRVRPRLHPNPKKKLWIPNGTLACWLFAKLSDCVILFLVVAAVRSDSLGWPEPDIRGLVQWARDDGVLVAMVAETILWGLMCRFGMQLILLLPLIEASTSWKGPFCRVHPDLFHPLLGFLPYIGAFSILLSIGPKDRYLDLALWAFVMVDFFTVMLPDVLSILIDWRSDRWVLRLARQLRLDRDPRQRREAAEKLRRMGTWAAQARASLQEAAFQDEDAEVQDVANAALLRMR